MHIIYRHNNEEEFRSLWNEYLDNNLASFRFLMSYIDYNLYYSKLLDMDYSFVIKENGHCAGICFLPLEKVNGQFQISLSAGYTVAPLCTCERVEKIMYKEINCIANRVSARKIMFYLDPLVMQYRNNFNTLLQHGYIDTSSSNGIVDLRKPLEKLWGSLNKSYRPLINGINRNPEFSIELYSAENADYKAHECYRDLHRQCSGRETRPRETFDRQFDMVKENKGIFVGLKHKHSYIGFNYFLHFQNTAIYYSGADNPAYENTGIAIYHPILWAATEYYKNNGFEFLEFSEPCGYNEVNSLNSYLDRKQLNISKFKRGMGADMVTLYRGIRYLDDQEFLKDLETFKNKWIGNSTLNKNSKEDIS
ncbi:MAG: hypothetical protein JXR78_03570 [Victivallales bacterium]|nr:hypothetical protein [Victivallales bacterium]